jgi:hypothetical protein
MIQNASTPSWLIMATTLGPGDAGEQDREHGEDIRTFQHASLLSAISRNFSIGLPLTLATVYEAGA